MTLLQTGRGGFQTIIEGPEEGPVIVLLHGFPELNISWRHQIPELAAAGYRVLAPNQRGYAGSVRDGSYATADLAADVVAMLDAVGAERAVVVGHDWGGGVAWTVAQLYPERVTALVAMNCPPPRVLGEHLLRSPRQLRKSWYMLFFQLPVLPERFVNRSMPGMLRGGSYVRGVWDRKALTPYAEAFATEDDARGPINWYRAAFSGALRGALRHSARTPHPIAVPVLVIWGVHDAFLGQEMVSPEALRTTLAFPNEATVVPIESAGHFVQNEAAEEVTAALLEWLASNAAVAH
jgi:pimeloyl-ACP methyl ester carboxylesterase